MKFHPAEPLFSFSDPTSHPDGQTHQTSNSAVHILFSSVLQAAGRVIRSENDKGVIIFADDRYAEEKYKKMMPERFKGIDIFSDIEELSVKVDEFWHKN